MTPSRILLSVAALFFPALQAAAGQPQPVGDLKAAILQSEEVTLQWTAPVGLPVFHFLSDCHYEIRLAQVDPAGGIEEWWNEATAWPVQPRPKVAGSAESIVITGIDPTRTTWFVLQTYFYDTKQEVEYWSELSNAAVANPQRPDAPSMLQQVRRDGTTAIAHGGLTAQTGFIVKATVTDPIGKACRLEVEFRAGAAAFDETGLLATDMAGPGGELSVPIDGLTPATTYRWRARTVNELELASGWVDFGLGDAEVDLATPVIPEPTVASLRQSSPATGATLGVGETMVGGHPQFEALVHQEYGIGVRLEVEVRELGQSFTGTPTVVGLSLPGGGVGVLTQGVPAGFHHWQARAVDLEWGIPGAWVSFGGNAEGAADFEVQPGGSTGGKFCSGSATGDTGWLALAGLTLAAALATRNG